MTEPDTCLTDGSPLTEDYRDLKDNGQQKGYKVLCPKEREKGYIRPYRDTYIHRISSCNSVTTIGFPIAETYARDPNFYSSTFCVLCGSHFPVEEFVWDGTNEVLGS